MGKIIDRDLGWRQIKANYKRMDGSFTKVGVFEGAKHKDEDSGELSEMVVVAAVNEFGTRRIPERSFVRSAFDMSITEIKRFTANLHSMYLTNPRRALGLLGEFMEAKIKARIVDLRTPLNSPATIKRKKSSNPLIDSGQLRQGITHVEVMG